ncbi:hypothetical protein CF67_03039 [Candidatus Photodesmus blepharus]|uniref:Endonuclease/exonuclease/phosphatase domain-containing protein n=1 Tax=Candidatus Photodesmus blepharonis TaxID=1179155 RepID=A0A084CN61_9GAMM|nr:endonuclease/exonuclease/phosphatase family protein [Candidatus Photodesmus blepharus]KEY91240.1 hypothetical protein CF67_03039 [Candidatus Photodesmus blepharus]
MQLFRCFLWMLIFSPVIVWLKLAFIVEHWWLENFIAVPNLLLVYYLVLILFFISSKLWLCTLFCITLFFGVFFFIPPMHRTVVENCIMPITIVQFNVFYGNQDVNAFINYLIYKPADLVVLQEVSPKEREKFKLLDDIYPFQYGEEQNVGYSFSQMILSKAPLMDMSVFHTSHGHNIISGSWNLASGKKIKLFTAHLPSPRTKELWYRRNMLLSTIEYMVDQSLSDEILVIGDFNLSANSVRFLSLFPNFQSIPVASWPNWIPWFSTPSFAMISIDHLWLKSIKSGWKICIRTAKESVLGSDHRMVLTKISY